MQMDKLDEPMVEITKWQDVTPFSNKIVAYTTNSSYYGLHKGYPLNNNTFLKYGLISQTVHKWVSGDGYQMYQLLRPNEVCRSKALICSDLKNTELCMRKINADEVNKIWQVIKANQAEFEYWGDEKAQILCLLETQAGD